MEKISFVRDIMEMDPERIDKIANIFAELITGLSGEREYKPETFMKNAFFRFCSGDMEYDMSCCEVALWEEFVNYIECAVVDEINHIIKKDNLDVMNVSNLCNLAAIYLNEDLIEEDIIVMRAELIDGTGFNYEIKEPKDLQLFVREIAQNISDVLQERNSTRNAHETAVIQYLSENMSTADLLHMIDIDLSMTPKDLVKFAYDKLAEAVRNMTEAELEKQYQNIDSSGSKSQKEEHEIEF